MRLIQLEKRGPTTHARLDVALTEASALYDAGEAETVVIRLPSDELRMAPIEALLLARRLTELARASVT